MIIGVELAGVAAAKKLQSDIPVIHSALAYAIVVSRAFAL